MTPRFEAQGERDGFKYYARDYRVFSGARTVRTMTSQERADYDRGHANGTARVDGRRLIALGYDRD